MANKKGRRDSHEVDALIAEVERLSTEPDPKKRLSVLAACKKVKLEPSVYYFRKRKEEAIANKERPREREYYFAQKKREALQKADQAEVMPDLHTVDLNNKDTKALMVVAKELEDRLKEVKLKIAESMMKSV